MKQVRVEEDPNFEKKSGGLSGMRMNIHNQSDRLLTRNSSQGIQQNHLNPVWKLSNTIDEKSLQQNASLANLTARDSVPINFIVNAGMEDLGQASPQTDELISTHLAPSRSYPMLFEAIMKVDSFDSNNALLVLSED